MHLSSTFTFTLLSALVAAVPNPAYYLHQQVLASQHPPERSSWRTLSDKVIGSIWGRRGGTTYSVAQVAPSPRQGPAHIFAIYGDEMLLRFNVSTAKEAQTLAVAADTLLLDVWEFTHDWVDIRLSKHIVGPLLGLLPASLRTAHTPLLSGRDLAQAIHDTYPVSQRHTTLTSEYTPSHLRDRPFSRTFEQSNGPERNIFFSDYQPLSVIEPWMRLLASLFTTHVRKISIGKTHQGRDIPALRVGVHPANSQKPQPKRQTILITGGIHAREWISTSSVNFIAYSLITGYGKLPHITRLLEAFDFVFIPTLNPDGYVYTWEIDRLWRKNRQPTSLRFCQGIDLDRAFGFEWDGANTTPCSESFAGDAAFEAVEAQQLAAWARNETENHNVEFAALVDLHSYSQAILYPYSYSCAASPPGLENLEELAYGLAKAIRVSHGHAYEVMPACEGNTARSNRKAQSSSSSDREVFPRIEASGGSALDWFYHELHVQYAYQIKLRDRGTYGFLLPRENIVPTGKEILDAVLYLGGFLSEQIYGQGLGAVVGVEDEKAMVSVPKGDRDRGGDRMGEEDEERAGDQAEDEWEVVEAGDGVSDREDFQWDLRRRRRR